jgi:hypothetical protein
VRQYVVQEIIAEYRNGVVSIKQACWRKKNESIFDFCKCGI